MKEKGNSHWTGILFIVGYFLCEIVLVSYLSNGAGLDDAEQLANSRFFAWGYGGSQPPLYTWLTILVTHILGTNLISLQLIKFSLLASLFLSIYATMRKLGASVPIATAAMMGLFLLPQIAWESQRALTHSVLATAGCSWTLLAFIHYTQKTTMARAFLLGSAMAVALLGKFNAIFFIIALFTAALSIKHFRTMLKQPSLIFAPLITLVLLAPTLLWIASHGDSMTVRVGKLAIGTGNTPISDRFFALWQLAEKSFYFIAFALLIAVACLFFSRKKIIGAHRVPPIMQHHIIEHHLATTLLARLVGFGLLAVAVVLIVSGATQVKDRWLQPVLFVFPALLSLWLARYYQLYLERFPSTKQNENKKLEWATQSNEVKNAPEHFSDQDGYRLDLGKCDKTRIETRLTSPRKTKTAPELFTRCCLIVAMIIPIILGFYMQAVPPKNKPPIHQLDYADIYSHVIAGQPIHQILSTNAQIGGNMRLFQPHLEILHLETPDIDQKLQIPFVVLWTGAPAMPAPLETILTNNNIALHPTISHMRVNFVVSKAAGIDLYYAYYPALH